MHERTRTRLRTLLIALSVTAMQFSLVFFVSRAFEVGTVLLRVLLFPASVFSFLLMRAVDSLGHAPPNAFEPPSSYLNSVEVLLAAAACLVFHVLFWYGLVLFVAGRRHRSPAV